MNKYIVSISITVAIIVSLFSIITFSYNSELKKTIKRKDDIIKEIQLKDSILDSSTQKYAEQITKYVTNCSFDINGKIISAEELLKMLSEANQKNERTRDSLKIYMEALNFTKKTYSEHNRKTIENLEQSSKYIDSAALYKTVLKRLEKDYGITYLLSNSGDSRMISIPTNKADSALIIYKYYKHKLSSDGKGNFTIEIENEGSKQIKNKKK